MDLAVEANVVARRERLQLLAHLEAQDLELGQLNFAIQRHRLVALLPTVINVARVVPIGLNLDLAPLSVHGKVLQIHGTRTGDCQPNGTVDAPIMANSDESVLGGCLVEVGRFFICKKGVRKPNFFGKLCAHTKFVYLANWFEL